MTGNSWDGILEKGETLLWQGQPGTRLRPRPGEIGESLFGLLFIVFSIVWMRGAMEMAGGPIWMFGLIFLGIGSYNFFGKYVWQAYKRRHTWYTLSDRAAYIAADTIIGGRSLKTYPLGPDSPITHDLGRGHIWFAEETYRTNGRLRTAKVGFENLEHPSRVLDMIRDVQEGDA